MSYQALYRKYRPNSFSDFIDQDGVKNILVNSIKGQKISHAYLFSGPRGIGKTSMAKIFAKAINCECFLDNGDVCNKCDSCVEANNGSVDIIEIDAASNNGVDQIRELKNKIAIVPSNLKYKVYIIDEVHMLTNSAFNALLKTLEEPPSYVVFILATTEFYEVPETIVSRCQCYSFKRISQKSMENRLRFIADNEKIKITDGAITEIAQYSNGGLRDAISMLDKIRSFTSDEITVDIFKNVNGMISQQEILKFYDNIINKNVPYILREIEKINDVGYDFKNFIERLMYLARDNIVDHYLNNSSSNIDIQFNISLISALNDLLNRLKDSVDPLVITQIYLLKFIDGFSTIDSSLKDVKNISQEIIDVAQNKKSAVLKQKSELNAKKESSTINNEVIKKKAFSINEDVKNIRINNAMATASIKYKKELLAIWNKLDDYFMDSKFGKVSQLLSDTVPMVVGTDYLILSTDSSGIIDNVYLNLLQIEDFLTNIYHLLKVVVITNEEFENVKNKYILDKKNNVVYQVMEECDKLVIENNDLIGQAIDIFGSDLVDIE